MPPDDPKPKGPDEASEGAPDDVTGAGAQVAASRAESTAAAAEIATSAELALPAGVGVAPKAGPRVHPRARHARRGIYLPRGSSGLALAVALVLFAGLASGPLLALERISHPGSGRDVTGAVPVSALLAARPWPSWVEASPDAAGGSSGGSRVSGGVPSGYGRLSPASASSVPPLSTGFRGWAAQPPAAVLARGPSGSGQPNPVAAEVRGIYLTAYTAGQTVAFRNLVDLVDSTALNAMVINIKDEQGHATYDTQVQAFRDAGAISVQIQDLPELLRVTKAYGIYTIGRLVTFEDSTLSRYSPELAVRRADGSLWRDRAGNSWTDAFRPEVWDYNLALAEEAAQLGFDEIQFDYVRFPTDGDTKTAVFSQDSGPNNINRVRAITEFLNYARARLFPYGTLVSADVFGIILSTSVDTSLGQVLEDVTPAVDYLSPMIYPSHYGPGHFGLSSPDAEPYWTIRGALTDALDRLGPEAKDKLRPWLQDFTLYNHYGPEQVLDQIRATHELGIKGWLLWNPANVYTSAALRAYTVNQDAYLNGDG